MGNKTLVMPGMTSLWPKDQSPLPAEHLHPLRPSSGETPFIGELNLGLEEEGVITVHPLSGSSPLQRHMSLACLLRCSPPWARPSMALPAREFGEGDPEEDMAPWFAFFCKADSCPSSQQWSQLPCAESPPLSPHNLMKVTQCHGQLVPLSQQGYYPDSPYGLFDESLPHQASASWTLFTPPASPVEMQQTPPRRGHHCSPSRKQTARHTWSYNGCSRRLLLRWLWPKAHLRTHTGEKLYHCYWEGCGLKFACTDEMTHHYKKHTGHCLFECHLCDCSFSHSDHLALHMKKHQ
ncbi:Krueppel-like factor 2 [Erythrolamprus reginae]|uniref:Krueppel-like factor 2 n=1 Tax=Erythrolamprus reginae TaxID=121349 RepID=UPI00396C73BB